MRGFPKNLNTKADYLYVKENFPAEQWKPALQALLDSCKDWFFVKTLEEGEEAPISENYKVVEVEAQGGHEAHSDLYELKCYETCKMKRLGFTEDEIREALDA